MTTTPRILLAALACTLLLAAPAGAADTFSNPEQITITADAGAASPSPSTIVVAGAGAFVSDVNVKLAKVEHEHPEDFDIALVSPSGRTIALVGDACENAEIDLDWTFDADAASEIPAAPPCETGSYRPRDHDPAGDLDDGWPGGLEPDSSDLDDLVGEDANGEWELYVYDDAEHPVDNGRIANGWSLTIESKDAPATVAFSVASATVAEGGSLTVDVVRTGSALEDASVAVGTSGGTAVAGRDFTQVSETLVFVPGETRKTITVPVLADGPFEAAEDFSVVLGLPKGDARIGTPAAVGVTIPQDAQGPIDDTPKGDQIPPPQQPFTRSNVIPKPPSAGRCRKPGSRITFRPVMPRGTAIVRTELFVNGALFEDNIGEAAVAPIVVTMTGKRMRVRIRVHSHDGRVVAVRRTFRACRRARG